jgi:hypothetical protein
LDINGFAVQSTVACHEYLWFTKMCFTAMKYCKLYCTVNGVHKKGTVAAWCMSEKGMPVQSCSKLCITWKKSVIL